MTSSAGDALKHALSIHPEFSLAGQRILVLRAQAFPYSSHWRGCRITLEQSFKPIADALPDTGKNDLPGSADEPYDLVVLFATKHRQENLYHLAKGANLLRCGGKFIGICSNELGAVTLEKRSAELFGAVHSLSKSKHRVFWTSLDLHLLNSELRHSWFDHGKLQAMPQLDGLYSRPGVFCWDRIDRGSRLLSESLPALAGKGADLGAGYGYLCHAMLSRSPEIREMHIIEAERRALEATQLNLQSFIARTELHYHWHDVTQGLPVMELDWIITNPPFHTGKSMEQELGRQFIRASAQALRSKGKLYLVANRHLAYEDELKRHFKSCDLLTAAQGYKIFMAQRA